MPKNPFLSLAASHHLTETKRAKFDLAISLCLAFWPTLTDAVNNEWGGPDSADKRDWLAGVISDLFPADSPANGADEADDIDIANVLLQVMQDEFELDVQDESDLVVARQIMQLKQECDEGNFSNVDALYATWQQKQSRGGDKRKVQVVEGDQDTDASEEEEDDGDVEMDEAPSLVPAPKPRTEPEIDEEGFTKVVGRRKR